MSPYEHAIAFWFGRTNYEQSTPLPDDFRLDRMRSLLRELGDPQERFRIVHVAGSKGKGSTSAMLATILQRAGYRTGLFTSPHLRYVEERIQVNDCPITHEELAAVMADIEKVVDRQPLQAPTFFEIATALGFLHFARRRVEIAVVEVGLGGRFDSTNVCMPVLSVITSISFDHTKQLGNTLASIAREKAGIVKPGRPVVSGATVPEAAQVIEAICRQRRSALTRLGADIRYTYQPGKVAAQGDQKLCVTIQTAERTWPKMELGLLGEHQAANAALAVACVEDLRSAGLHITDNAVKRGLRDVTWPARMEVLARQPLVVVDCAHNVASIQALLDTLAISFPAGRRLLVFASSNDKDLAGMIRLLTPHFAQVFLAPFNSPRSTPPEELAALWQTMSDRPTKTFRSSLDAWKAAQEAAAPDDLICITGSVFLAGELRQEVVDSSYGR